jgi:carbonyl reductase 1
MLILPTTKVAVVTGDNRGIGYFTALQLGLSGVFRHVILGCRDLSQGQQAAASIQSQLRMPDETQISALPLVVGNPSSHSRFVDELEELLFDDQMMDGRGGNQDGEGDDLIKVDLLVNNAAIAFKAADPTPFEEQTKPTLDVNFRGTIDFTEQMLPLIRNAGLMDRRFGGRIINVASSAGRLDQLDPYWQDIIRDPDLSMGELQTLVDQFEKDVVEGVHLDKGWPRSNYGMSKLALIAATRILARDEYSNNVRVNSVCPGSVATEMSSGRGRRTPSEGAEQVIFPCLFDDDDDGDVVSGEFFANFEIQEW